MENMYRVEKDSIGTLKIPIDAYYGIHTLRAKENFQITDKTVHKEIIKALVEIKMASAQTNAEVGVLKEEIKDAIIKAGNEILSGKYWDNFIVDAIQGGAGTSTNMNINEILANRAIEILGGQKGDYSLVHPNDHVNCGQSTNDVYPSAGRIAVIRMLLKACEELKRLEKSFNNCSERFKSVIKMGRTEMQDAVPIGLGRSFGAYAKATGRDIMRFYDAVECLSKINMGGTAIGTGINADKKYISRIVNNISDMTGLTLSQAKSLVDATQNADELVYVSGIIKSCAVTLSKISNDLRLMSSGPRCGLGEINLPSRQNGSSIMPGKINPVIPEMISQISYRIIGNDVAVTMAAESGQLELNAFEPIIFYCVLESLDIIRNGIKSFIDNCIDGITANEQYCKDRVWNSIGIVTALSPYIGYSQSSQIAKEALKENKKVYDIILEKNIMSQDKLDNIFEKVIYDALTENSDFTSITL